MSKDSARITISEDLLARMRVAKKVSVLTGAGVSADSGIATFRGAGGIWEKFDFQKLASPIGFKENPRLVWEWYQLRQIEMAKARPNPAHLTLAEMEKHFEEFTVITQNIDGFHKRAGSRKIIELHGNIWRMRCPRDGTVMDLDAPVKEIPPFCQCGSMLRPDVVWFGEQLSSEVLDAASKAAAESDVMFVVGTSAVVFPAAALPALTKNSGGVVIEVNTERTDISNYADASFFGRAGELMPDIWLAIANSERFMTKHPFILQR